MQCPGILLTDNTSSNDCSSSVAPTLVAQGGGTHMWWCPTVCHQLDFPILVDIDIDIWVPV